MDKPTDGDVERLLCYLDKNITLLTQQDEFEIDENCDMDKYTSKTELSIRLLDVTKRNLIGYLNENVIARKLIKKDSILYLEEKEYKKGDAIIQPFYCYFNTNVCPYNYFGIRTIKCNDEIIYQNNDFND